MHVLKRLEHRFIYLQQMHHISKKIHEAAASKMPAPVSRNIEFGVTHLKSPF